MSTQLNKTSHATRRQQLGRCFLLRLRLAACTVERVQVSRIVWVTRHVGRILHAAKQCLASTACACASILILCCRVWNLDTGDCTHTLDEHTQAVNCVALSLDAKFLVSGSQDETIKWWNTATDKSSRTLEWQRHGVTCMTLSLDGRTLVSGSGGNIKWVCGHNCSPIVL
ncbi:serine/threonine protein kinase [Haematococcus lacustris]|uniref:Serine/threonine protein kinase n=1 Tax=Haematococcus lacustris TaxID=44745 RepID=A0A699YIY1_HAELA|nr:serine/threonine protein kinase [Haematococcus lacustris]